MEFHSVNNLMLSLFDNYIHTLLENVVPLVLKKLPNEKYTFVDANGVPQHGGKIYDKDMAERVLFYNKERVAAEQEEPEEIPEEPEEPELETLPIRGEYWFDESGNAQYADGDVGDMNHEAYVIQLCEGELAGYFNINLDLKTISDVEDDIVEAIKDEVGDSWGEIENDPADAMIKYLVTFFKMPENKASDLVLTAYGSNKDAREYAIKNWNWIRVHGANIEVNKLNKETLKNVARGINDALEQEGEMYEDDSWERAGQTEYHISTYTGKRYTITLDDMEAGNISGLEEEPNVAVSAASQQLRKMDLDSGSEYYKKKNIIGDSFDRKYEEILKEFHVKYLNG